MFPPKNEQTNSTLLLWNLRSTYFRLFFGGNWRHQKNISKLLFGITNSPKKRTKYFDFTTMIPQVDFFSLVFWEKLKTPKRHFEIKWPLFNLNFAQCIILLKTNCLLCSFKPYAYLYYITNSQIWLFACLSRQKCQSSKVQVF